MEIHAPRRYGIWQRHDRARPRYHARQPAEVPASPLEARRYLRAMPSKVPRHALLWEQAGFAKHRRQKHVSRVKGSIDILLNTSCRSYTLLSTALLLSFLSLPFLHLSPVCSSRSLRVLLPSCFFVPVVCLSADPLPGPGASLPAYQPISLRSSVFLALQSRHSAFAGVKSSMTVPVAIVRYGWLC